MAECTHITPEERERRESHYRMKFRPFFIFDMYTWRYPYKMGSLAILSGAIIISAHNSIYRKPWYYGIYPRVFGLAGAGMIFYCFGWLREYNYKTRDAVIDHYVKLHQDDFERVNDIYGRPFSSLLLPWYPQRAQYRKFD